MHIYTCTIWNTLIYRTFEDGLIVQLINTTLVDLQCTARQNLGGWGGDQIMCTQSPFELCIHVCEAYFSVSCLFMCVSLSVSVNVVMCYRSQPFGSKIQPSIQ